MLDLALLGLLADGPRHGYDLQKRLAALPGVRGASYGSLYPALRRLARAGYITSVHEPAVDGVCDEPLPPTGSLWGEGGGPRARKVHALTEAGRARLRQLVTDDGDDGDDRVVAVRLAFLGVLDPEERRLVLDDRRRHLTSRLERLTADLARETDPWRRRLLERERAFVAADLSWLDETAVPAPPAPTATTPGGTP